ncbi:ead/Ea22-like family protein [Enterobacter hormaechei]|uniref:ead/Ea22-like family protein n=1 Tax=Enterobacter hormaechei TaxID=158836 RepID=UPI00312CAE4F|nr:ead/Ea22-like family protein [Enterobacter hormaechei]
MSNIDKRALREAAEKAGSDKWQAKKINGDFYVIRNGSYEKQHGFTSYQPIAEIEHKPVRDFVVAANPATVLAVLDELEARDKSISFLKDQLAQLANFNPDWDKLEAATDSLREHMAELTAARKRIAELSTSHSNLREAMAGIHNTITAGGAYTPLAAILNASKAAYEESAAAAGKGEAS